MFGCRSFGRLITMASCVKTERPAFFIEKILELETPEHFWKLHRPWAGEGERFYFKPLLASFILNHQSDMHCEPLAVVYNICYRNIECILNSLCLDK